MTEDAPQFYVSLICGGASGLGGSDLGGIIFTSKGMKKVRSPWVSFKSKEYSWATFSGVHVWGSSLWLLSALRASTMEIFPLGTSVISQIPYGSPGKLYFNGLRSSSASEAGWDATLWKATYAMVWKHNVVLLNWRHIEEQLQCMFKLSPYSRRRGLQQWLQKEERITSTLKWQGRHYWCQFPQAIRDMHFCKHSRKVPQHIREPLQQNRTLLTLLITRSNQCQVSAEHCESNITPALPWAQLHQTNYHHFSGPSSTPKGFQLN